MDNILTITNAMIKLEFLTITNAIFKLGFFSGITLIIACFLLSIFSILSVSDNTATSIISAIVLFFSLIAKLANLIFRICIVLGLICWLLTLII